MAKKRRTYLPRLVGDKVMMPADLKRLHKYMLDIERIDHISDEMRAVLTASDPSWHTSCRRRGREAELISCPVRCITGKLEAKESPGVSPGVFQGETMKEHLGIKMPWAHLDIFASACRPASVIRTRTTPVCWPSATMRSRFVVASPALTSSTIMSIENPCARRIALV